LGDFVGEFGVGGSAEDAQVQVHGGSILAKT
jgi:hypothetical protein